MRTQQEVQSHIDFIFVFHQSFYCQDLELIALGINEHNLANVAPTQIL